MVLLEIDSDGILAIKFESDAPRAIDVDGISGGIEPVQRMKIETWQSHIFRPFGGIETIETNEDTLVHLRIDP